MLASQLRDKEWREASQPARLVGEWRVVVLVEVVRLLFVFLFANGLHAALSPCLAAVDATAAGSPNYYERVTR